MACSSSLLKSLSFLSLSQDPSLSLKPQLQSPSPHLPFPPHFLSSPKPSTNNQLSLSPELPKPAPINPPFPTDHSPSVGSVICPSLAYANIFFFKENFSIICGENESEDEIAARFARAAARAGVFYEMKRRRFFLTPREKVKIKSQLAAKRLKRAKMRAARFREVEPRKPKILIDPLEEKKRNARIAAKRRAMKKVNQPSQLFSLHSGGYSGRAPERKRSWLGRRKATSQMTITGSLKMLKFPTADRYDPIAKIVAVVIIDASNLYTEAQKN